jgi:hypothetical protein
MHGLRFCRDAWWAAYGGRQLQVHSKIVSFRVVSGSRGWLVK